MNRRYTSLTGVFSLMNRRLASPKLKWDTLLRSKETKNLISKLYGINLIILDHYISYIVRYLKRIIASNGITTVCKAIKALEHEINLGKGFSCVAPLWIGKKVFFRKTIPEEVSRIYLTVHRNMYCEPILQLGTIQFPSATEKWQSFIDRYELQLNNVSKFINKIAHPLVEQLMGEYYVKKNPDVKHAAWNYIGNLSNDPTVDSNDRTGGLEYPLRVTLSNCTNGPALSSQLVDAWILSQEQFLEMREALQWLFKMYDYKVDILSDGLLYNITDREPEKVISKVVPIQDKSCKTRVIAVFDTYSQVALRPIHFFLENFLRRLRSDYTFDHDKGVKNLLDRMRKNIEIRNLYGYQGHKFYSFDISSATDTIPKELGFWAGFQVLKVLVNDQFTDEICRKTWDSVQKVLINRDFKTPRGDFVRYTCGQPMGAYGSFPLLALSQHTLVWLAAEIEGVRKGSFSYAVVGDDLVINHDKVALTYERLANELGIPINTEKSIVSENKFEFCKRIAFDGELRKVPSLSSYFVAALTGSPGPLISLYNQYGLRTPHYNRWGGFFGYGVVRSHIAFMNLEIHGGPTSVIHIPDAVKTHADRCIFVLKVTTSETKIPKVLDSSPYLKRLNYGASVLSIFKSNIKKLVKAGITSIWMQLLQIRANTFYLAYEMSYQHYRELRRLRRKPITFLSIDKDRIDKLRRLCMQWKNAWVYVIKT